MLLWALNRVLWLVLGVSLHKNKPEWRLQEVLPLPFLVSNFR